MRTVTPLICICTSALLLTASCSPKVDSDGIRIIDADLTGKEITDISLTDLDKTVLEFSEESIIGGIKDLVCTDDGGYIIASGTAGNYRLMQFDRATRAADRVST